MDEKNPAATEVPQTWGMGLEEDQAVVAPGPATSRAEEIPCALYPSVPGIDSPLFQLPTTPDNRGKALKQLDEYMKVPASVSRVPGKPAARFSGSCSSI